MRTISIMPEVPIVRGSFESTIDGAGEELAVVVTAGGFDKMLAVGVESERGTVTRVAAGVSVIKPDRVKVTRLAVTALGPSPNSEVGSSELGSSEFGLSEGGISEGGISVVGLLGRDPVVSKIVKRFERDRI
jgi:hypothetical protein